MFLQIDNARKMIRRLKLRSLSIGAYGYKRLIVGLEVYSSEDRVVPKQINVCCHCERLLIHGDSFSGGTNVDLDPRGSYSMWNTRRSHVWSTKTRGKANVARMSPAVHTCPLCALLKSAAPFVFFPSFKSSLPVERSHDCFICFSHVMHRW